MLKQIPQGFFITAAEQREVGMNINDSISDHAVFTPPSFEAFVERAKKAQEWREIHAVDGRYAETQGDTYLVDACRRVVADVDAVFAIWKNRWLACSGCHPDRTYENPLPVKKVTEITATVEEIFAV